jgi:quinol monooxygenase YgiN
MGAARACTVIELRQYTLRAGQRDVLIELFDRELLETQEAAGCMVIGQFRDLDDANRFVWLRGFADMADRARALQAFYGGPAWEAHRERANATMIDSDDVLLLRPATAPSFPLPQRLRPAAPHGAAGGGIVIATVCPLALPAGPDLLEHFEQTIAPALRDSGASILGVFTTENSANNFPRLPVREGVQVFVWLAGHHDQTGAQCASAALDGLRPWLSAAPQLLPLAPTSRSRLQA